MGMPNRDDIYKAAMGQRGSVVIYGDFTSVTLTSGTVLGYLKD